MTVQDYDGTVLFYTQPYANKEIGNGRERAAWDECVEWLQKHFPDWQNPFACWFVPTGITAADAVELVTASKHNYQIKGIFDDQERKTFLKWIIDPKRKQKEG